MNILVTGGSGFIGTYLVADLLEAGHDVAIYDRQRSEKFAHRCIIGDIRDEELLADALQDIDAVFHLAAEHRDDVHPESLYYDVNVVGTENVVYACRKNDVSRIVFTSTVAVYGLNPGGVPDENSPVNPFNEYGRSKLQAERVLEEWATVGPQRCLAIVRPSVIFGEGNRGNVYTLLNQIVSGRFVMVGSGKNKKSMAYVGNLSKFLALMLNNAAGIHMYNYTDTPDYTIEGLVELIYANISPDRRWRNVRIPYAIGLAGGYALDFLAKLTGKTYPISSIRIKKFCADSQIDADKAKATGFQAPYPLSEGLIRMIKSEFPSEPRKTSLPQRHQNTKKGNAVKME